MANIGGFYNLLIDEHPLLSLLCRRPNAGYRKPLITLLGFLTCGSVLSLLQLQCYTVFAEEEIFINSRVIIVWTVNVAILTCISWAIQHVIRFVNQESAAHNYSPIPECDPDEISLTDKPKKMKQIDLKKIYSRKSEDKNKMRRSHGSLRDTNKKNVTQGSQTQNILFQHETVKSMQSIESRVEGSQMEDISLKTHDTFQHRDEIICSTSVEDKPSFELNKTNQTPELEENKKSLDTIDVIWYHLAKVMSLYDKDMNLEKPCHEFSHPRVDVEIEAFARSFVGSVVATLTASEKLRKNTDHGFLERRLINFFSRMLSDELKNSKDHEEGIDPEGLLDAGLDDEHITSLQSSSVTKAARIMTERNVRECCQLYASQIADDASKTNDQDEKSSGSSLTVSCTRSLPSVGKLCDKENPPDTQEVPKPSRKYSVHLLRRLSKESVDIEGSSEDRLDTTIKASLEMLTQVQTKEIIRSASLDMIEEGLKQFAQDFVSNLCVKGRIHMDGIIHQENNDKINQSLASGDISTKVLPTLAEYASDVLKDEFKNSSSAARNLQKSVIVGQYIDTMVTNAFLKTEKILEYSQDYLTGDFLWQVNNSNGNVIDEEKKKIMQMIMDQIYQQLDKEAVNTTRDEVTALFEQKQRIISDLSNIACSDVGTYLIWHAVQQAHDKVTDMCDTLDIRELALQRGWINQLGDNFLTGGSGFQDHLSIVEMTSDYISGVCLAEGCSEVAQQLVYILSSGSVDKAIETGLKSLADTSFEHAEESVQKQLLNVPDKESTLKRAVPLFSTVAKMFVTALRLSRDPTPSLPVGPSPLNSSSSFSHSSISGGTPTPVVSLQEKLSLAITDSDPYVLQVTSCEDDVHDEPLLKEISPGSLAKSTTFARKGNSKRISHKNYSRCDIYTIVALSFVTVAFTCASFVTALTLNSEQTYTWFMVLLSSFMVQILVLEPLKSVIHFIVFRKK